jgi:hypothetical protein
MSGEQNIEHTLYYAIPPRPPTEVLSIIHPDDIIDDKLSQEPETEKVQYPMLSGPETEATEFQRSEFQGNEETFIKGQFMYVKDKNSREMLVNAWNAINQLELWNYMRRETYSYMFSDDEEICKITLKMEELGYNGHSGFSFGWTMRQMQYIAKNGEETYMKEILKPVIK